MRTRSRGLSLSGGETPLDGAGHPQHVPPHERDRAGCAHLARYRGCAHGPGAGPRPKTVIVPPRFSYCDCLSRCLASGGVGKRGDHAKLSFSLGRRRGRRGSGPERGEHRSWPPTRPPYGPPPRSLVSAQRPPQGQQKGGLSDSAVRVLMSYAFSVIPEQQAGPDGKQVKLDKSDPNKFLIPDRGCAAHHPGGDALGLCRGLRTSRSRPGQLSGLDAERGRKEGLDRAAIVDGERPLSVLRLLFRGNVKITDDGQAANGAAGAANPPKEAAPARRPRRPGDEPRYAEAAAMPARAKAEGRGRHQRLCSVRAGGTGAKSRGPSPGPGARSTGVIQRQLTLSAINV